MQSRFAKSKAPSALRSAGALHSYSRRDFLTTAAGSALALHLPMPKKTVVTEVITASPNGNVLLRIFIDANSALKYQVNFKRRAVIEPSAFAMIVDDVNLTRGVAWRKACRIVSTSGIRCVEFIPKPSIMATEQVLK